MRTEKEIREEFDNMLNYWVDKFRVGKCRFTQETAGYIGALKWVLGEEEK